MLLFMSTASASSAGTAGDTLITLSYLENVFAPSLRTDISKSFKSSADKAMLRLDEIYRKYVEYSFTPGYMQVSFTSGDSIMLTMGGSVILLSGSATLTVTGGAVINISTGSEAASGSQLNRNQRYFCTEETTARITANSPSTCLVDGYYIAMGDGVSYPNKPHAVFRDVLERHWFFAAVDFVYEKGLFQGTSDNIFSPGTSMTRGMFVTVLHRLDGRPEAGAGGVFTDVQDTSQYYFNAVTWANANSIVTGYGDGTFRPNTAVTREQMAAIMHRYAAYKGRDMSAPGDEYSRFPDRSDVSDYAVAPMQWAVSRGVINGSDGLLLPGSTATRAQVAQIIYNYVVRISE